MIPADAGLFATLAGVAAATLVSEDLTTIGVGLAIRDGQLPWAPALAACAAGIYIGDVGLWAAGRWGGARRARWPRLASISDAVLRDAGGLVDRHPALTIIGSRFLPGTRLPLYVAAGIYGTRPARFLAWMLVAVLLWTPLLAGATVLVGQPIAVALEPWLGSPLLARVVVMIAVLVLLRVAAGLGSREGRTRWRVRLARWRHWEFWPLWLFQLPIAGWLVWLALRHRSLTLFSAANPAIEDGGIAGESKSAILSLLPADAVMPWTRLDPGPAAARLAQAREWIARQGDAWPVVLKPDVGERGTGVRLAHDEAGVRRYLDVEAGTIVLQAWHPGPYEAGLFYVRHPAAARGTLFSITDKRFPAVVGDGRSRLRDLVLAHPRYRLQAEVFLARLGSRADEVPEAGAEVRLAQAGNHCQGTEFRDGRHLATADLEAAVDRIARAVPGFHFGRFDVRYADAASFARGEGFRILELNGVTSEATHIYDPDARLVDAWWTLARQWSMAFAIGAANREAGHAPIGVRRLASLVVAHLRRRPAFRIAD